MARVRKTLSSCLQRRVFETINKVGEVIPVGDVTLGSSALADKADDPRRNSSVRLVVGYRPMSTWW